MESGYFDHNATTPLWPAAREAWLQASDRSWLNPSSAYRRGAAVKVRLEAAREAMAEMLAVGPERLVFNSGATEGNNTVFAHWVRTLPADARVAVSPVEHPSVLEAAKAFFQDRIEWLSLDASGQVDMAALEDLLDSGTIAAVSLMSANNETGILHDWQAVAGVCVTRGIPYHCDASQWIGKMPLVGLGDCDFVTGCAHKFGGPKGVGFLILPKQKVDFCSLHGGAQESGYRAGTEDVASILAMQAALSESHGKLHAMMSEPRDRFIADLKRIVPEARVVGESAPRLWNTVSVILPDFASSRWIAGLEKSGFLVSAGSACSTGKQGPSHVLAALGEDGAAMRRVIRISSGWDTSSGDWQALLQAIVEVDRALRDESSGSGSQVIEI